MSREPHIPALDGLRGVAIILVLFVHFIGNAQPWNAFEGLLVKASNYGLYGVDLFFVLSGYLITGILVDSKASAHHLRNFYMRRVLRIFPLYYAVLFVLFYLLPHVPSLYPAGLQASSREQVWLWSYSLNFFIALRGGWVLPYVSHFWSLSVEEHFYLLWPFIVAIASWKMLLKICAGCVFFSLVLRIVLSLAGTNEVSIQVLTPCRLDALCTGGFLAVASRHPLRARLGRRARSALTILAPSIVLVFVWCAATKLLLPVFHPIRELLIALFFGALLVVCVDAEPGDPVGRFFSHRALRVFGKYSYGLYVFQGLIAYYIHDKQFVNPLTAAVGSHLLAVLLQAVAGAGFSFLLAVASYEWFEKRFLRLKRWFGKPVSMGPHPESGRGQLSA